MKQLINKVLAWWGLVIVSTKQYDTLQTINHDRTVDIMLREADIAILEDKLEMANLTIMNNKFLPSNRPNLDLAVDTVLGWSTATRSVFIHRFVDKLGTMSKDELRVLRTCINAKFKQL